MIVRNLSATQVSVKSTKEEKHFYIPPRSNQTIPDNEAPDEDKLPASLIVIEPKKQ